MGCIQVKLTEDLTSQNVDQILMTSWCSVCHEMTPSVKMSKDTGCLSFAKYLELRFHSHAYKRRVVDINTPANNTITENRSASSNKETEHSTESPSSGDEKPHICSHSLHRDHVQYFSYNGIVASFSYTAIEVWEIVLPCIVLDLRVPRLVDTSLVLEDIKNFALRGYEVYAKFQDKLAELSADAELPTLAFLKQTIATDQSAFRDKVATVQTLLTEKNIKPFDINDAMLLVKKILADSIEFFGPNLTAASTQNRTSYAAKPELNSSEIDSGIICTEDLKPEPQSATDTVEEIDDMGGTMPTQVECAKDLPIYPTDATDAKEKIHIDELTPSYNKPVLEGQPHRDPANVADKKSVKTILRELLASDKNAFVVPSPIPSNEHFCLPLGKFPVLVYDNDLSSVIAYTLVSEDYRKALTNMQTGYSSDTGYSPKVKRRSQDGLIDGGSSGPDDKETSSGKECGGGVDKKACGASKTSMHAELSFQDLTTTFTCKIYFAREFDAMRANYIGPPPKNSSVEADKNKSLKSMPLDRKSSSNSLTLKGIVESIGQQESDDVQCAFARSLCESIPWEARGGKSGSKFCKTYGELYENDLCCAVVMLC